MDAAKKKELREILLTCDGKGQQVKGEALQDLLDDKYEEGISAGLEAQISLRGDG